MPAFSSVTPAVICHKILFFLLVHLLFLKTGKAEAFFSLVNLTKTLFFDT